MSANPTQVEGRATPLEREAMDWYFQAMPHNATAEVRAAAEQWKNQSPAHAAAYAKAAYLCQLIATQEEFRDTNPPFLEKPSTRRAALTIGVGAIAAYAVVRPPLQLWPSLAELTADYRSGVGQRQAVAVAQGVSVELNTDTSLLRRTDGAQSGIQLVSGEIAVTARRPPAQPFTIFADSGQVRLHQAVCDIRRAVDGIRVLCLDGEIEVQAAGQQQSLAPRQQLVYTSAMLGKPSLADPVLTTSWREGRLVFRDAPFRAIVAEVNRYRSGRIMLISSELAERRYNAVFEIAKIGGIVNDLRHLSHASATTLGNVTILS